ncbi:hypothetical protein FB563_0015 [Streptomyces puniciscabiei]|uniref:Uncharacterized protein n=1 Tax=Streptomyces puniciscabiei TaxID=164348 RepID=A0A542U7Y5_9ACTN|nr:hypothetical protein [Streptomyces puniciscabiei]TQK95148.1 hypothetical protein FB563_0015 [Streptomyces puniciscabiei]
MTDRLPPQPITPPPPAEPPAVPAPVPVTKGLSPLVAGLLGLAVGAGIVGGAWAITAGSGPGAPGTFTLKGGFELTDSVVPDGDGGCAGTDGYDDISDGTSVTVYDAAGSVVATGALSNSRYDEDTYDCSFDVAVQDVPKGQKFYKVEVSHRGTLQLTAKEAETGQFGGSLG